MARIALIKNGVVENVIEADIGFAQSLGFDTCVESDIATIGDGYVDGAFTRNELVAPDLAPQPAPAARLPLTKLEYMNRFTDAELAGIYTAAKSVIEVEIWLEKFKLATEINLDDPRTVAGVQALEAVGLIGPGRAAEILA